MKPANYDDQQLFDSLRQSPTELSLDAVNSMISTFPDLPPKPAGNNNWTRFFNLNNLIMLAIPIAIALGVFLNNGDAESPGMITNFDQLTTDKITQAEPASEPEEETTLVIGESTKSEQAIAPRQHPVAKAKSAVVALEPTVAPEKKEALVITPTAPSGSEAADKKPAAVADRRGAEVAQPVLLDVNDPAPQLGGMYMRKLKRNLYKNLKADGFIQSKYELVEMELPGDKITVNGKELDAALFLKYSTILRKVGAGPDRMVKMNRAYIKAGDFTEEGFRGTGVGTFVEQMAGAEDGGGGLFGETEKDTEDDTRERELREEQRELGLFSQEIIDKNGGAKGRKKLFPVSLNTKKSRELFDRLKGALVEDELIVSEKDYVLIELPKDEIRINGQVLDGGLEAKYKDIFDDYKIGRGAVRQVRLSEHIFSAGDYGPGSFTGTTTIFD